MQNDQFRMQNEDGDVKLRRSIRAKEKEPRMECTHGVSGYRRGCTDTAYSVSTLRARLFRWGEQSSGMSSAHCSALGAATR